MLGMRTLISLAVSVLAVAAGGQVAESGRPLAIRNVTVVDVASGRTREAMTIVIQGPRLVSVTPANVPSPNPSTVIDGTGKFAIPGLWDMHTHYAATPGAQEFMNPLWILNGTTGIRNLGLDTLTRVLARRDQNESGLAVGPRIVTSGQILDGAFPVWPWNVAVGSAEDGRRLVEEQLRNRAEFIKVYGLLSRDAFFAIADEAKLRKIPVVGHVPMAVTATEASNAGMKSMEHLHGVLYDASSKSVESEPQERRVRGAVHRRALPRAQGRPLRAVGAVHSDGDRSGSDLRRCEGIAAVCHAEEERHVASADDGLEKGVGV
jgi:hypothetical protein